MHKYLKWSIWGIILILSLGYGIYELLKPLNAEVIEVQPGTIIQSFEEEGSVVAKEERPIHALGAQRVIKVYVEEGQNVKAGDTLVQLDTEQLKYQLEQLKAQKKSNMAQREKTNKELEYQLRQLKAELKSLEGQEQQTGGKSFEALVKQQQLAATEASRQLASAKKELQRIEELYNNGAASLKELENAQNHVQQLQNQVLQQEQALQALYSQSEGIRKQFEGLKQAVKTQISLIEYQLGAPNGSVAGTQQYLDSLVEMTEAQIKEVEYRIQNSCKEAPIDGIVSNIAIKEGMVASPQAPLMTLFKPGDYEIEVFVLAEDVKTLKTGIKVKITQENRDQDVVFGGNIINIAPSAVEQMSALGLLEKRVKVTVKPEGSIPALRPGYTLDVEFITHKQDQCLAVPKTSVFPYNEGYAVWVVRNGKAKIQPVTKGLETDLEVVITKGLNPGDKVIKNPDLEGLKEGKRISQS